MKKIAKALTHPLFISSIGLLLLSLLIWFIGPKIKFGIDNTAPLESQIVRLAFIMCMITLWGLNNLRLQLKSNKYNNDLVEDIKANQELDKKNSSDGKAAEEIQQMSQRFAQALTTLKSLRFSGSNASKALYELPWYIIVGPPGSGKTTALINSGLDFPLAEKFGKNALQGVGGTRNCDWWFTNDAVLIDTAGRYTTQDSHRVVDSSAWEGFLKLLKKNRKRRPINGALVAISLHDLLIQTDEERIQHAKMIRTRLDELMERLEIRFPIYLVFTKVDLVSGFSEFFEDLSKDERDQVWGVSLPNAPKLQQSPDFDFLANGLGDLIKRLYDRVLWRMNQEREVNRRGMIEGFPKQMENLKSIVEDFTEQAFVKNRYRFQPYLRGVYFASGTQDGTPIDRLMTSVSSNFGFSRDTVKDPYQQGKTYFLSKFFQEVVFPEAELVGANVRYEKIMRWTRRLFLVALAIVSVSLLLVWMGSITQHKLFMTDVTELIDTYDQEQKKLIQSGRDIRSILPPLNALANTAIIYDQKEHPWLTGLGMYDGRIDREAGAAYEYQLKNHLLPQLIYSIEKQLNLGHEGGDLYSTFHMYMMFQKPEHLDRHLVREWFVNLWEQQLQGEASRRQELTAHIEALLELNLDPIDLNNKIVSSTRNLLLRVPVSQRIYSRIKSDRDMKRKVNMRTYLGPNVISLFNIDKETEIAWNIPLLYTIDGYKSTDFSQKSNLLNDIVNERWMLDDGEDKRVDFVKDDLKDISSQVKDHYLVDYLDTWNRFYQSFSIASFASIAQANDALSIFGDPVESPFISILELAKTNTRLTPLPDIQGLDKIESANYRLRYLGETSTIASSKIPTTKVDKRYQELNDLLKKNNQESAPIDHIISRIALVHQFVQEIAIAPDPQKRAFSIVKARYVSSSPNPMTALSAYAKKTPPEIRGLLTSIADQSWKVIVAAAHSHINTEWRASVYMPYSRALAGRYPLNNKAEDELALYDFSEFFRPEGTVDSFYSEFIKPFVNTRKGWRNRTVDGYSMGFSERSLKQVSRALSIKNIFFRENPEIPTISLELRPYALSENVARFTLDLGGQRFTYKHGPKFWKPLTWSGSDENKRVRIVFENIEGGTHDQSYSGPWAWFRLMDQSQVERTNQSNVYNLNFNSADDDYQMIYQGKVKSINNPFSNNFLAAFRCPEKL